MKANLQNMYAAVEYLTTIQPSRNFQNAESLEIACLFIQQEFAKAGGTTKRQTWKAAGEEYTNIITSYNAGKPRRLVVGAHYDVCGDQPGADDNASAVAGLLELARMVFQFKPDLPYQLDFVAYCLEEPPFFGSEQMGSYVHAKSLYDEKADVIGMISLEMIGFFSNEPNLQPYPSAELSRIYPSTANFIVVVGIEKFAPFNNEVHQLMSATEAIDVQVISFPPGNGLAGLSDQRNYWTFGYPALMINDTAFIRNPHYHMKTDTIDTLDFEKMTGVVSATYHAITNLSRL